MLNLIAKDFKLLFAGKGSIKQRIISAFATVIMLASVIGIEFFIFYTILSKIQIYNKASIPFLTLFLFIISCLTIFMDMTRANRLFFNQKDIEQLMRRPVSNGQIVVSKLVFLFATHYFTTLMLVYPVLIAYGNLVGKPLLFFYLGIFYPALSFLFEGGIALMLVYPYKLASDFMKKHTIVQFAFSIVVMVGACMVYNSVLGIFMNLVVNNNINAIFTQQSIQNLINLRQFFVPINFLVDTFFSSDFSSLFLYACIAGGIFVAGIAIVIFAFSYFRSIVLHGKPGKTKDALDITTPMIALIKKELFLLFKDSNNIFSFTGLLIVQPFLVYIIIDSMNSVFSSGSFAYYMVALPELIPLINVLIIMLFTLIINQGANEYIQAEKGNVRVMKTIPISPIKQLFVKVIIPFGLSAFSLLVTVLWLCIAGEMSWMSGCSSFLLTLVLLAIFDIVSLKEEMRISNTKPRSTFMSTCYSYLLPIAFFAAAVVSCIFGLELIVAYLVGMVVFVLLGIPHVIKIKFKLEELFLDLEMVN